MVTFSNSSLEIINLTSIQMQLNERVKHFAEVKNGQVFVTDSGTLKSIESLMHVAMNEESAGDGTVINRE